MLLVASLCFASFTFGVSAADGAVSASAVFGTLYGSKTCAIGDYVSLVESSRLTNLTVVLPSAGTAILLVHGAGTSTVSGPGVTSTLSGSDLTVTVEGSAGGSVGITTTLGNLTTTPDKKISLSLISWTPGDPGGGGGGDEGYSGDWTLGNNFGDWRPGLAVPNQTSTSTQWKTYNQYIGEYVTTVTTSGDSKSFSGPADSFFVSALSALTYDDWSWGVGEDGKMYFSPPAFASSLKLPIKWCP